MTIAIISLAFSWCILMVSDRLIILGLSSVKDVATLMDMGPAFHFLASFCMSSSFSTADLNERHIIIYVINRD